MRGATGRYPVALSVMWLAAWRILRRTRARMRLTARHASTKIFGKLAIESVRTGSPA
jgi:hypothetical protein